MKKSIDICLSPLMLDLFDLSNKLVVVIDVFRATSAMCVFLNNGGQSVKPVSSIEEALKYKFSEKHGQSYIVAAERNGEIVSGFDLGNSPLLYKDKKFNNVSLAITTTNGTFAIEKAKKKCKDMILASFLNANAVVEYIISSNTSNVLIVCSGWKGRFCMEDVLLAGLLTNKLLLTGKFISNSDSVLLASSMYGVAKNNIYKFLSSSSYVQRMNLNDDVQFCLQIDIMSVVPVWIFNNSNINLRDCFVSHNKVFR